MFGGIFILILVVLAIWYFTRGDLNFPGRPGKADTALEVLRKRFAHGDINKEEYEEKKKILEEGELNH